MQVMGESIFEGEVECWGEKGDVVLFEKVDGVPKASSANPWLKCLEKHPPRRKSWRRGKGNTAKSKKKRRSKVNMPSDTSRFPLMLGGVEVIGHLDSCSDFTLVAKSIWESMKGVVEEWPAVIHGVKGSIETNLCKRTLLEVPGYEFEVPAYAMEDREDDCKVLIPSDVGAKFGVVLSNLPKFHVSRVEKTDDEEWLESVEEIWLKFLCRGRSEC